MHTLKQKKIFFIASFFLLILLLPAVSYAHGLVPCGGNNEAPCNVQDIFVLISRVTNFLIFFAGIYAVYQIVNAGFWMVVSMGEEEAITKRKNSLTNAVVGFVIVMMAYILINTAVNYILLASLPSNSPLKVDLANPFNYLTSQ